jgi:exonuclease III
MGDFNEAMWQEEHFSNTARSERLMMDFREVLSHCDLHDIGFIGAPWTYDNKRKGDRNVKVRLDRAVATPAWSALFPEHRLRHIVSSRSDHCPILLSVDHVSNCHPTVPIRRSCMGA